MSKIALEGNVSGTGVFTLASPNGNTNRTLTLPDSTGTIATVENLPAGYTDADALDLFNATGSAPVYACRMWVKFNGTGTPSVIASGNVSSITDRGVGQYDINFTTALPTEHYSAMTNRQYRGAANSEQNTTTYLRIFVFETANSAFIDLPEVYAAAFC